MKAGRRIQRSMHKVTSFVIKLTRHKRKVFNEKPCLGEMPRFLRSELHWKDTVGKI